MLATLERDSFDFTFHINILQHTDYFIDGMMELFKQNPSPKSVVIMTECLTEVEPRVNNVVAFIKNRDLPGLQALIKRIGRALAIVYNI